MFEFPSHAVVSNRRGSASVVSEGGVSVESVAAGHPLRSMVEAFIADGFAHSHGATILHYMPALVTLRSGEIKACLGVRPATETLFVEQYLDAPIERAAPQIKVPRAQIVEIGNLVSTDRHATLKLFMVTAVALHRCGYREMVFCATRKVASILKQVGAPLQSIVEADGRRLGDSLPEWGRYYDTRPVVMRLNLDDVITLIEESPLLRRQITGFDLSIETLAEHLAG